MKKQKGHLIRSVEPGSIADELGIHPGDRLISINGTVIEDVFDYRYLTDDEELTLLIYSAEEDDEYEADIEKDADEDLGIEFEAGLMDEYRHCSNKCIFCFIDQMPPGMRETLYFKDDDARLSFLQGNYVTLTNMSPKDVERICFYKLSPINVSIHTTNPELRCKMLHNRFAGDALKKLDTFCEAGIEINGQIVLCKGWNDGAELDRTLGDIEKYLPNLISLSVVPVGLTKFREGLCPLEPFGPEESAVVIDQIEKWQKYYYDKYGTRIVYASDEWYLKAGREIPSQDAYEGFPQMENGVGMVRTLLDDFDEALAADDSDRIMKGKFTFVTGKLIEPILRTLTERITEKYPETVTEVVGIRNDFFGNMITVAGLVTGQDILAQLKDRDLGDFIIMPSCMLRAGESVLLDDLTVEDLQKALQTKIRIVKSGGSALIDVLCDDYTGSFEREVPYEQTDSGDRRQT
ncbi:MAG: DUF512 domain-containing protein [Lachnospiraceae bacterium]|nr:DUF512 domain-containing protein [Lachnospiraceae bacterium]